MGFLHNSHIPINLCTYCGFVWIRGCGATQSEFSNTSIIHFGCFFFSLFHILPLLGRTFISVCRLKRGTSSFTLIMQRLGGELIITSAIFLFDLPLLFSSSTATFFFKVGVIFLPCTVCSCLLTANDS